MSLDGARELLGTADREIAAADRLLHVAFVARRLDVAQSTVRGWIRGNRIRAIKTPGGYYRIPASELERIVAGR